MNGKGYGLLALTVGAVAFAVTEHVKCKKIDDKINSWKKDIAEAEATCDATFDRAARPLYESVK